MHSTFHKRTIKTHVSCVSAVLLGSIKGERKMAQTLSGYLTKGIMQSFGSAGYLVLLKRDKPEKQKLI